MITHEELNEAIAECLGKRNPDVRTCLKLASYLIIRRELYGDEIDPALERRFADVGKMIQPGEYSFAAALADPLDPVVKIQSGTDFAKEVNGMQAADVWPIMDELMEVLRATAPRLYNGVMRRLRT